MAKPIRNTPVLYGQDAVRFLAEINDLPSPEERRRERERIKKNSDEFLSMIASLRNGGN